MSKRGWVSVVGIVLCAVLLVVAQCAVLGSTPPTPNQAFGWGSDQYGQLGRGGVVQRTAPAQIPGLSGFTAVNAGDNYCLGLKGDGTVWAWGDNNYGQSGSGSYASTVSSPVQVLGLTGMTAVAAGTSHGLALAGDGTVWAWGSNYSGELGDGTTDSRIYAGQVPGLVRVAAVAAGSQTSYAVTLDGAVWAWGYNGYGELGDGTTNDRHSPVQVVGLTGVTAVAAGSFHALARKVDGTVWGWGYNPYGQVGDGTTDDRHAPVQAVGLTDVTQIAAGGYHSLARKSNGTAWSWGTNWYGELGLGTYGDALTPTPVPSLSSVTWVASGINHSLFRKDDGSLWACGDNGGGELGERIAERPILPGSRIGPRIGGGRGWRVRITRWRSKGTGRSGSGEATPMARRAWDGFSVSPGPLRCWESPTPSPWTGERPSAPFSEATARCGPWVGTTAANWATGPAFPEGRRHRSPASPPSYRWLAEILTRWCAVRNGSLWAWGYNGYGQVGDGTNADRQSPVAVSAAGTFVSIAAGNYHSLAARNDGTVWAWGRNTYGQLGDGTITQRDTPVQVPGITTAIAVAAHSDFSLALLSDGTLLAWGSNWYGQLGDGTTTDRHSPVPVTGLTGVTAMATGWAHCLALKSDGSVWSWGYNGNGALGDGTWTNRSVPGAVSSPAALSASLTGAIALAATNHASFALMADGSINVWGSDQYGQLGDGAESTQRLPVTVSGVEGATAIGAGMNHAFAAAPCVLTLSASGPTSIWAGQTAAFTSSATPVGCSGTPSYDWDFGDGTGHSSQQNPGHVFSLPGWYNWTLTATAGIATAHRSQEISVCGPSCYAYADTYGGRAPLTVNFTD